MTDWRWWLVTAVGAALVGAFVIGVVHTAQRLTPCERRLEAWEQDPRGCRSPWLRSRRTEVPDVAVREGR